MDSRIAPEGRTQLQVFVPNWNYQAAKSDFVFGGYDAKSCAEKVRKMHDPSYEGIVQDDPTPGDARRMEEGNVREQEVIDLWVNALPAEKVLLVPQCDRSDESKLRRAKMTVEAMADPGDVVVIINARLPQMWEQHRTGEPDALVRHGKNSRGNWVWLPVDMKDHRSLEGTRKGLSWPVSKLENPTFDSVKDTVLTPGIPQKVDALQLAHYHRMLETMGHANDKPLGAIIGRETVLLWHDLEEAFYNYTDKNGVTEKLSAMSYYDKSFNDRLEIAKAAKKGIALTGPEWKTECEGCIFRTVCHDELKIDRDHITLLPGVTPARARAHYDNEVETIAALSRLHHPTAVLVDNGIDIPGLVKDSAGVEGDVELSTLLPKVKAPVIDKIKAVGFSTVKDLKQIDAKTARYSGSKVFRLADTIDQARATKTGKVFRTRGVDHIDITRARIEEDIDIEDAPHPNGEGSLVYMIGVRDAGYSERNGENIQTRTEYHCFADYSGTDEGEAKVFAQFWAHVSYMRQHAKVRKYGYRAFHYSKHEDHAFRHLAKKHEGKEGIPTMEELDEYLNGKSWVDLFPIVSNQLIWPTERVTLKDVAKWVRFSWRDSDPGGGNSITWYMDAVKHLDPEVRAENQKRLAEYNADDCHAQLEIRDWLSRLGETRQPGNRLPSVATLDKRFYRRRSR